MSDETLRDVALGTNPATGPAYWIHKTVDAQSAAAGRLRDAQERLEGRRRKELNDEAAAREAAANKAKTAGARVGSRSGLLSGFAFGAQQPGAGAGNLFGN